MEDPSDAEDEQGNNNNITSISNTDDTNAITVADDGQGTGDGYLNVTSNDDKEEEPARGASRTSNRSAKSAKSTRSAKSAKSATSLSASQRSNVPQSTPAPARSNRWAEPSTRNTRPASPPSEDEASNQDNSIPLIGLDASVRLLREQRACAAACIPLCLVSSGVHSTTWPIFLACAYVST